MTASELDAVGRSALAVLLPDTPENVISRHLLQTGQCRAWREQDCLLIESERYAPGEPHLIGSDPAAVLELLRARPGWHAANVDPRIAESLVAALGEDGLALRQVEDRYFTLRDAPTIPAAPPARLLRAADAASLARAREEFASIDPALGAPWTIGAASFDGEAIVSLAAVTAQTPKYANISTVTLPGHRGKGHATAATAALAAGIVAGRRQALWSCAETNEPSLALAHSLGFAASATRVYLVREKDGR